MRSGTCEVPFEHIGELADESESSASPIGSESYLLHSIDTRKRKRDPSNDLDLKRAFRRLTLTHKALRLDLKEPLHQLEELQDMEIEADMDDGSGSDAETPGSEDFGPAYNEDLMIFDWPNREETTAPNIMGIKGIRNTEHIYIAATRQYNQGPGSKIWTCVSSQQT
jgi:hypothetical protein